MVIYGCRAVVYALLQIFSKFIRTLRCYVQFVQRHIVCLHCCEIRRRCRFLSNFCLRSFLLLRFSLCFFSVRKMCCSACAGARKCWWPDGNPKNEIGIHWKRAPSHHFSRKLLSSAVSTRRVYLYTARFTWLHTSSDNDGDYGSIWNWMRMRLHIFKSKICRIISHFCLEKKREFGESTEREKVRRFRNTSSCVHALPPFRSLLFLLANCDGQQWHERTNVLNIQNQKAKRKIAPSQTYRIVCMCAYKMLYMRWMGRNGTIFMEKVKETNFPRLSKFYPKWDVCVCVSSGAQRGRQMKEKIVEKNVPHQDKNGEENAESGDDGTKQCHRHTVEIHRRGRGRVEISSI